jgi:hypothetical protein
LERDQLLAVWDVGWGSELLWISMGNLASPGFESQTIQPIASDVLEYQNEIKTKFTKILRSSFIKTNPCTIDISTPSLSH